MERLQVHLSASVKSGGQGNQAKGEIMAEKTTHQKEQTNEADSADAALEKVMSAAAKRFRCPQDGATRFHKAEFGSVVDGVFVVDQTTFRCVSCHDEYEIVDGKMRKAE